MNWKIVFKNGTELYIKGGNEVMNAADPANGATVLRTISGKHVAVNAIEVLYVMQERA